MAQKVLIGKYNRRLLSLLLFSHFDCQLDGLIDNRLLMPFVGDDKDQYLSCNNVDEGSCHQGRWKSINNNPSTWGHPEDQISFDKRKRKRERKNISLCFSVISINAFPSIIDVVSLFLSLSREIERVRHLLPDLLELYIQCDQIGIFLKLLEQ